MRLKITSETGEPIRVTEIRNGQTGALDPSMVYLDIGGYPTIQVRRRGKDVRVCARCCGSGRIALQVDSHFEQRACPACGGATK